MPITATVGKTELETTHAGSGVLVRRLHAKGPCPYLAERSDKREQKLSKPFGILW